MRLNPSSSFETTQHGVDALPGACRLMRELLLAQGSPDDAVAAPRLVQQNLRDTAGEVQENQVRRRLGEPPKGGRNGTRERVSRRRHACAQVLDSLAWDQEQLAFLQGFGVGGPGAAGRCFTATASTND